jgi:hypothetical protein
VGFSGSTALVVSASAQGSAPDRWSHFGALAPILNRLRPQESCGALYDIEQINAAVTIKRHSTVGIIPPR